MNKIIRMLRDGTMQRLIIARDSTEEVAAGTSLDVELDIGIEKMLMKSLEVTCSKNVAFRVEFFEEPERLNSRYNSDITKLEVYDVFDLPYVDQRDQGKMYFRIHNVSEYPASFTIEARGLELK